MNFLCLNLLDIVNKPKVCRWAENVAVLRNSYGVTSHFLYFNLSAKILRFVLQMQTIWKIEDEIKYFIFSKL